MPKNLRKMTQIAKNNERSHFFITLNPPPYKPSFNRKEKQLGTHPYIIVLFFEILT